MKILVDADSCPKAARDAILRAIRRTGIQGIFAANRPIPGISNDELCRMELCETHHGAADDRIVELAEPGDLVITRDIPLAHRLVEANISVLDDRGRLYTRWEADEELSRCIPEHLARRYNCTPVAVEGNTLLLAIEDPSNMLALDDIRLITGFDIDPVIATDDAITKALNGQFGVTAIAEVEGTIAVITPAGRYHSVTDMVAGLPLPVGVGERVSVLTALQSKGLEYDAALVVSPDEIVEQTPGGIRVLYVALTRPTWRLATIDITDGRPGAWRESLESPLSDSA